MQSKRNYWHQIWTFCRKRMLPIIMLVIFVISFWFVEKSDVQQIGRLADETLSFLETVCQRYDGYASGQTATRLKDVYDKNQGVRTFATSQELVDREYLQRFIQSQGLTGIVVTDADAMPVAWAETDGTDASDLWQQFLQNENRKNIIEYPNKVYNGNVNIRNVSYDVTIVSRNDSEGLILCYSRAETASTDIYEASLAQTMTNNTFHKNPDIVISDTQGILATNVSELGDSEFLGFRDTNNRDMSGLIKIHMGTKVWYGKCQVLYLCVLSEK